MTYGSNRRRVGMLADYGNASVRDRNATHRTYDETYEHIDDQ